MNKLYLINSENDCIGPISSDAFFYIELILILFISIFLSKNTLYAYMQLYNVLDVRNLTRQKDLSTTSHTDDGSMSGRKDDL